MLGLRHKRPARFHVNLKRRKIEFRSNVNPNGGNLSPGLYINVMPSDCSLAVTSTPDLDAARSAAGRALQRPKRRRRPPEDARVVVPVDARTKAGRAVRVLRERLIAHLGPRPTQVQLVLVEQLLQLKLRLAMMDHNFIAAGGKLSAHDSRTYLAWSNSMVRGLRELGLDSAAADAPAPTLAEALAAGAEAARGAPADAAPPAIPAAVPTASSVPEVADAP